MYSINDMYGCINNIERNKINTSTYIKDYGADPLVINIEEVTEQNDNFRIALWTGEHLQITLMTIPVGESIGLEVHPNTDQFIRVEQGIGLVQMGEERNNLNFTKRAFEEYAVVIPAGKWHNITNIGSVPLKVYSIYAPPNHPKGTIHKTKEDAEH